MVSIPVSFSKRNLGLCLKTFLEPSSNCITYFSKLSLARSFSSTSTRFNAASTEEHKAEMVIRGVFDEQQRRDRESFLAIIERFKRRNRKTGHIEFIYVAMKRMYDFGVHEDLEIYRQLIDVMPKKKMVPKNLIQAEFFYFPRHQHCIIDLLQQMEENGVTPDWDMQDQLISIFGHRGYPVRRYWRMMYWMPKFKNLSPWPIPKPLPADTIQLAKLAVSRITSVDNQTEVKTFNTLDIPNTVEETWVVTSQSPTQKKLLQHHPLHIPVYVEGPYNQWLRKARVAYFVLKSDPIKTRKKPSWRDEDVIANLPIPFFFPPSRDDVIPEESIHEQQDAIIYAVAATGSCSKESLLAWIKWLEGTGNPNLRNIPVLFRMRSRGGYESATEEYPLLENKTITSENTKE